MAVLKRIGPASAFRIGLVSYALLGFIAGIFCSIIALTGASFCPMHMHFPRAMGVLPMILCPVVWGIMGGVTSLVGALIYNLASRWVGGVEVEIN